MTEGFINERQPTTMADTPVPDTDTPRPHPTYADRYCAFIDILGFRELVRELAGDISRAAVLRSLLSKIHSPPNSATERWHIDFRAQSISDAVAISTLANLDGLLRLFTAIEHLAFELLKEGYFIRGALVKGKLYHDEHMVFAEALIRAYEFESTVARFPRVMVLREVKEDIDAHTRGFFKGRRSDFEGHLKEADDGPYYIHVLADMEKLLRENDELPPEKKHSLDVFVKIQALIQKRLNEARDNPHHFEKVQWFARYWQACVAFYGYPPFMPITGPGMDIATWRTGSP
jgi:hypothetical protein